MPRRQSCRRRAAAKAAIEKVPALYPPPAKAMGVKGVAVVEIPIAKDRTVESARGESGHPMLVAASLASVRKWKFKPILLNGVPIRAAGTISFEFGN